MCIKTTKKKDEVFCDGRKKFHKAFSIIQGAGKALKFIERQDFLVESLVLLIEI